MLSVGGSDWCGPCIALKKNIFDTPEFDQYASKKFIFVYVDLPRDKTKITAEQLEKNKAVNACYKIGLIPTVLVLNNDGVTIGGFQGGQAHIAPIQIALDQALSRKKFIDKSMANAQKLKASAKAQALMDVYRLIPNRWHYNNQSLYDLVLLEDPDDSLGFAAKRKDIVAADNIATSRHNMVQNELDELPKAERIAHIDSLLAKPDLKEEDKLRLQWIRLNNRFLLSETKKELIEIKKDMLAYADTVPEKDKKQTLFLIKSMFDTKPALLLDRLKASRDAAAK